MSKEYTYDIDKYTIGVDENGEDGIGMTIAIIKNGEINFLGNCYGENARCIDLLIKENQKLKKQLEEYKATNKILSHELTKDKILQQDCLTTCCGIPIGDIPKLITQQKEFIKYLEDEKDRLARECSQIYEDSLGHTRLVNEDIFNEVDKNLSKYRSIIGDDK